MRVALRARSIIAAEELGRTAGAGRRWTVRGVAERGMETRRYGEKEKASEDTYWDGDFGVRRV